MKILPLILGVFIWTMLHSSPISYTVKKEKYVTMTQLKMKLVAWSAKYSHTPAFCGKQITELKVFTHSAVLYQNISMPPKY